MIMNTTLEAFPVATINNYIFICFDFISSFHSSEEIKKLKIRMKLSVYAFNSKDNA